MAEEQDELKDENEEPDEDEADDSDSATGEDKPDQGTGDPLESLTLDRSCQGLTPEERKQWASTIDAARKANVDASYVLDMARYGEQSRRREEELMLKQREAEKTAGSSAAATPEAPVDDEEPMTRAEFHKRMAALREEMEQQRRLETNSQIDERMCHEFGVLDVVRRQGFAAAVDSFAVTNPRMNREQLWRETLRIMGVEAVREKSAEEKLARAAQLAKLRGAGAARGTPAETKGEEFIPVDDPKYFDRMFER